MNTENAPQMVLYCGTLFIGGVLSRVIVRGSVFPVFFQFGFEHINNETHEEKE